MPRSRDDEQLALFAVGRVPNLWTRDFRSVGELLADTDFQSRALLMDLAVDDAPALLVGWPDVLNACADLWRAFPSAPTPVTAQTERRTMELLVLRGNGYRAALQEGRAYLEGIQPDPRLTAIAKTLTRTTRLVATFGGEIDVSKQPAKSDLAAARTRALHTLYLTVHAVHSAMRQLRTETISGRDRPNGLPPIFQEYRRSRMLWILDRWVQRLGSTEASVGRALNGTYPRALFGEVAAPPPDYLRFPRALATWEIAVNRVLCAYPTNADLTLISRTEGLIIATGYRVVEASTLEQRKEMLELCEPVAAGWARSAYWWKTLTPTNGLVSDSLVAAASEVRAAARTLTFDKAQPASLETIAAHPEYPDAVEAILITFEHIRETASAISDHGFGSRLRGPARALSRAANDLGEEIGRESDPAWVSPTDTLTNASIPAPKPVAQAIRATAQRLESDASALAQAAMQVSALIRPRVELAVAGHVVEETSHGRHRPTAYASKAAGPRR